jgi:NADPH:quinone reductase-like Zn-dependent oxidoreductase
MFDRNDLLAEGFGQILRWLETGMLVAPPVVTYLLADVARAHADIESGKTVGKLVLIP